jgi:hypothetical protein
MWIRDPGRKNSDPGSGMEKIRIRDKHCKQCAKHPIKKQDAKHPIEGHEK